jgi:TAT (twin-arginine translocation) pathway signal sequence
MDRQLDRLDTAFGRRRFLKGTGGAAAAAGLASGFAWPALGAADDYDDRGRLPAPNPIPGGSSTGPSTSSALGT